MKTVAMKTFPTEPRAETAPVRRSIAGLVFRSLSNLVAGFIREMRIRRDMRHLERLSDNILSDIGIPRGHIQHALRQGRLHPYETPAVPTGRNKPVRRNSVEPAETGKVIRLVRPLPAGPVRPGTRTGRRLRQEA